MARNPASHRRSPIRAILWGAPVGLLGGLIGLGGAELRLPVLVGAFGYAARTAVALNLAIRLVMVVSALLIRGGMLSLAPASRRRGDDRRSCVGGELIIPTLLFGVGIKAAGTARLLVGLPTVKVGVLRHRRFGAFVERADITGTVAPMGAGSVAGAVAGGLQEALILGDRAVVLGRAPSRVKDVVDVSGVTDSDTERFALSRRQLRKLLADEIDGGRSL